MRRSACNGTGSSPPGTASAMSYPEWGVGNFGDNPFFIQQMHDWFVTE